MSKNFNLLVSLNFKSFLQVMQRNTLRSPIVHLSVKLQPGNTKGGSITVPLTSSLTGLDQSVLQTKKTKIVSCLTADSKPVKQEVNSTVIRPPLVFPSLGHNTLPM